MSVAHLQTATGLQVRRCGGCVMAGVFDLKKGAFDSSEAARLYKAYDIALQGLRATHNVDQAVVQRLARSIVKVARSEPDCLKNDGTIDPARLAQRAILRMLQVTAPTRDSGRSRNEALSPEKGGARKLRAADEEPAAGDSTSKIMQRLFDRSILAKL